MSLLNIMTTKADSHMKNSKIPTIFFNTRSIINLSEHVISIINIENYLDQKQNYQIYEF